MEKKRLQMMNLPALLALAALFGVGTITNAQSTYSQATSSQATSGQAASSQDAKPTTAPDSRPVQDNDTTRRDLSQFDKFLDNHREISEQLRRDPSLVNNRMFVENHPALQTFLREQPGVRDELKENPNAFMRQEDNFDRREDGRDRDVTHNDLARFNRFLDGHREIAEQLRKDPSLVDNRAFVEKHPALQTFFQEQPSVRAEFKENPNAFMRQEDNFDRHEGERDRDASHAQLNNFRDFLGHHPNVSDQLSKNPSLVKNHEFVDSHPEFREYLKSNPDVQNDLMKNPQEYMKAAQINNNNNNNYTNKTEPGRAPRVDAKPMQ